MVDIKEQSIPQALSDKHSDFEDAPELMDEEKMENLAYSGSDATSSGVKSPILNDDDFKDALDQISEEDHCK